MKAKPGISLDLLKITIAIFFILLGIFGILPIVEEAGFSLIPGQGWGELEIIFGIVELICGVIIILSLFTFLSRKIKALASLIILIFWVARILISKIVFGLKLSSAGILFLPDFPQWLLILSAELLLAASLWVFYQASKN